MDPSFVGSIFMTGASFAPYGWQLCQGQLLSIAENDVLYTLLGTTYGGDGVQTFGLPDLRGRVAINQGQGPGLNNYVMGQVAGNEQATMTINNMPSHTHLVNVTTAAPSTNTPSPGVFISGAALGPVGVAIEAYSTNASTAQLGSSSIGANSGGIPFGIIQPVLAVNYIIALQGIYPTQN